ncbi:bifunctional nicotinamidase/pyrazinamidase [Pararhodonellum marinum]|uniref:bifunctional nicotinamidase/pyrazinamidase n=1 Tax=Pararhodonellum marinum TaxID=2755358 RepID=UPI00188E6BDC|nr:bifunctional nicotinamidase/pyrazinamidase [Pararhodonellum marinum]
MKALLIVDVQNDFLPGGALAVPDGDLIIPIINGLQQKFTFVVATQDWHPATHGSFAINHTGKKPGDFVKLDGLDQILWPAHCVQGSFGAEFHQDLQKNQWNRVFQKGTDPQVDSYSGFYDNNRKGDTGLSAYLKKFKINEVFVVGLATDYCVKFTVLDALKDGFKTTLISDATKAVNLEAGDFEKALEEMQQAGARIIVSREII